MPNYLTSTNVIYGNRLSEQLCRLYNSESVPMIRLACAKILREARAKLDRDDCSRLLAWMCWLGYPVKYRSGSNSPR